MKIRVTKRHIAMGEKQDPSRCPVALAVMDVVDDRVSVGDDEVEPGLYPNNVSVDLPERAIDFIEALDAGLPVKPFSFELPLS